MSDRPNLLVVLTDDQRATGTLDVMPHTRRWFESGGTRFPQAVATTPVCGPSRASIFSGRYGHNHEVRHNREAPTLDQHLTLQRYLHEAGYTTAMLGKYLNDWDLGRDPPHFDRWAIFNKGYLPIEVNEQGAQKTVEQYSTRYLADHAVRFLEQAEPPWFLYVAPFAPHPPFIPEQGYAAASVPPFEPDPDFFPADRSDKPEWVQSMVIDQGAIMNIRTAQLRTLMSVDDLIERVFGAIEAAGAVDETLAFFLSDNGWIWGEHGLSAKAKPYTGSIGIPMFMRWPGHVAEGAVDERLAANIDLTPTVLEAAGGISPEVALDGQSLLDSSGPRNRVLTEFWGSPPAPLALTLPWASIRSSTDQYIECYDVADAETVISREYYDLTADPWQLTNLLRDGGHDGSLGTEDLSAQLAADRACAGGACP